MAWRDSRGNRLHLLISILAIALGIAGVTAIHSFSIQLEKELMNQSRSLLGADLSIRSLHPFSEDTETFLRDLPGAHVREVRFFSMARQPLTNATRLSHIRALSGPFPFYGDFVADPPESVTRFFSESGWAIVEESLLLQFDMNIGDTLRIGEANFTVVGRLISISGDPPFTSAFLGPRIFISMADLPSTELLQEGSLARYYLHLKTDTEEEAIALAEQYRHEWSARRLELETAEERRAMTGDGLINVQRFLNYGALAALLLGGIGLAGAIRLYVRRKKETVALLRCIGTTARLAFLVYVIQIVWIGMLGASIGVVTGTLFQFALPLLLADFLPFPLQVQWSWPVLFASLGVGTLLAVLFALHPLVPLRRISPLLAFRADVEQKDKSFQIDLLQWILFGILACGLILFSIMHSESSSRGAFIAFGLGLIFILMTMLSRLLIWAVRNIPGSGKLPFVWRQGIANLYRPYNQTSTLLMAIGLGTFLLATLSFTRHNLLHQLPGHNEEDKSPNMIFFDVQQEQVVSVQDILDDFRQDLQETTPIVTMRLQSVNGRSVGDLRDDPELDIPDWILFREYRTTYRRELDGDDRLIAGTWEGHITDPNARIPISIEKTMANRLGIGLGAHLVFDVQGVWLRTRVQSIRQVDWRQLRTNFFVIFPSGVLEDAPQIFAMVVHSPILETAIQAQSAVVERYPNISVFDLRMLVDSLNAILGKGAAVISAIALFSLLAGFIVMSSIILMHRYDRHAETTLWRTLGATSRQCAQMMVAEYIVLGGGAALSGTLLGWATAAAMAHRAFQMEFHLHLPTLFGMPVFIACIVLSIGWLSNRK